MCITLREEMVVAALEKKMKTSTYLTSFLILALQLAGVLGQLPLQNTTAVVIDSSPQCETLTVSMCVQRNVGYTHTIYPNLAGMFAQSDAEDALQSFDQLVQFGCTTMADFLCYLFAPPCLQVGGISAPVPPCREVCEKARAECEPMLRIAQVPWPEQFDCSRFPMITDGPVRCAEPNMRVYNALEEAEVPYEEEEVNQEPMCQEVPSLECNQLGFTHTALPNTFGHTNPADMVQDMLELSQLVVSQCSPDVLPLICGAYFPKCDPETGDFIMPCKESCRRISKECKDAVKALDLGRVDLFSCRLYPSRKNEGACVEDLRAPAPPIIMNTSRPAVSQAQLFFQQPSIPDVSVNGLEVSFHNVLGDDEGIVFIDTEGVATIDVMTPARYTIRARSVNAWGKSQYVDAVIPEFTGYEHCEPVTIPICTDFKYSMVQYPNLLQQASQDVARMEAIQFVPLIKTECSPDLQPFLCALYAPPCTRLPSPQGIKPPCRELCKSARKGCESLVNMFGYEWPDTMDCDMFPSINDVGRNCFNNDELILNPVGENGRGQILTDFGSKGTAYCSSSVSDVRPEWMNPAGEPVPLKSEDEEATVYAEELGDRTAVLTVTSLSAENAGTYNCRLHTELQPMTIDIPRTCLASESNLCQAEDGSSWMAMYPNMLGHTTPTEADFVAYQFLPLMATGCAPHNLPRFVCSLFHPQCGPGVVVPPCMELCMAAMGECAGFIVSSQWAWPDHAQCKFFPSHSDVGDACIPPIVPTTTTAPTTTEATTTQTTTQPTTTPLSTTTSAPDSVDGMPQQLLRRSYSITERGMLQFYRGWVDVQGHGAPNDFCRVVQTDGKPFLSCLLAGSEEDDLFAYTSPDPTVEWFNPGYSNTWYMKDEDGDGRDDYCRCIGTPLSSTVLCMKSGDSGFLPADNDFVPENAPDDCLFKIADPFFGY